jgi:predicted DNA-binding transcriptional regulator AlpA
MAERMKIGMKGLLGLLGCHRSTVDRYRFDPHYAYLGFPKPMAPGGKGGRLFWWLDEIMAWLETRRR